MGVYQKSMGKTIWIELMLVTSMTVSVDPNLSAAYQKLDPEVAFSGDLRQASVGSQARNTTDFAPAVEAKTLKTESRTGLVVFEQHN